ncbi:polymorphic toxin-type HINT domain-containing protein [Streptomyces qinglanensis]|uniref:Intein C-terminal splicing region/RHS repeat-associated core domain-containing protein n=1 Tax=Streptomyces qinglanensis TaxID=943816 RepID=A0A1H9WA45_9ACTN|nr:intein C-terminal splicing region/RHS repeat-associated core domain-containing protein [Streptomyces qinglanensis]
MTATDARGTTLAHVYDNLGRPTELREGSPSGELRAKWVYDSISGAKGQLTESTRYADGAAYSSKVTSYDRLYRPVKTAVVIPEKEGKLAGTYQTGTRYLPSGLVGGISYSAAGSLPGGGYTTSYEKETLRPTSVLASGFKADTSYSLTGKPLQHTLGATSGGKKTWITNTYEWGTRRLATSRVDREDQPGVDRHNTYRYDQAGNVLSLSDTSRSGTDTQCFTYDYLRRLTDAWTQSDKACDDDPTAGEIAGPAPYWHSYTYGKSGNRLTETQHDTGGGTKDTKRTYTYPKPGEPQPHALSSVTTELPSGTATRDSYDYDESGNTTTRTLDGTPQKLRWDAEGHLAKVTEPLEESTGGGEEGPEEQTTEYLYDADGNRLIARTPSRTTLYLGQGHTEVTLAKGADKPEATRYTPLGSGNEAVQQDDGTLTFTAADHQGTGQLAVAAKDLKLTQRRTLPFGGPRGEKPGSWPGSKSFVGGIDDSADTGLTHLGAREYDPATGTFLSVDPVMDLTDPQQINGYTYGNNSPVVNSDPTGLLFGGIWKQIKKTAVAVHRQASRWNRASSSIGRWLGSSVGRRAGYHVSTVDYRRPKPSPGPSPTPGPYPDHGSDPVLNVLKFAFEVVLPDADAWQGCISDPDVSADCASAAMDLPWFKVLKLGKAAAKVAKAAEKGANRGKGVQRGAKKGARSGCKCFLAGTGVEMADGSVKSIEDIELGDKVRTTDPKTGKTSEHEVTATIVTDEDKHFTRLTLKTPKGTETLTATDEHPFWSVSKRSWVEAGDLTPGTTLRTDDGHTTVTVKSTHHYTDRRRTYNLTVEGVHTYYVLAGQTPVLVHNSGGLCPKILDETYKSASTPAKLEHVIDPEKHGFADLVARSGGREQAMRRIVDSLGDVSDLPTAGRFEVGRVIDGENVTIRGAVVNGVPRIGTAFNPDKFPGGK